MLLIYIICLRFWIDYKIISIIHLIQMYAEANMGIIN